MTYADCLPWQLLCNQDKQLHVRIAQLAILPGKTHYNIMEAGEVADLVETFLKQL